MAKWSIIFFLLVVGCNESPYADMPPEQIHAKAQELPLEERYAFYVEVLHSTIPNDPQVADDLVLLGGPARKYVIEQALKGDRQDLSDALSALAAFKGRCTGDELPRLTRKARSVARSKDDLEMINGHISVACEIASPRGYDVNYDAMQNIQR